jgi:D-alanine transfer protein
VDWEKIRAEAILKGKSSTTNNSFGMDNTFYQDNLAAKLQDKKDTDKGYKLSSSPEYDDLTLLFEVLKEKGAKPLFVIIPMNGRWYDYTGLDSLEREQCYSKLRTQVQESGYPLADFTSHEYEDYYLKDPWHLAWKGWVDVDQRLYDFATEEIN